MIQKLRRLRQIVSKNFAFPTSDYEEMIRILDSLLKPKRINSGQKKSKQFRDGRERLVGKAWRERVDELFKRDNQGSDFGAWWTCAAKCGYSSNVRENFDPDHIRKRSLGRDDRLSNLRLLCGDCHAKIHDEFKRRKP